MLGELPLYIFHVIQKYDRYSKIFILDTLTIHLQSVFSSRTIYRYIEICMCVFFFIYIDKECMVFMNIKLMIRLYNKKY